MRIRATHFGLAVVVLGMAENRVFTNWGLDHFREQMEASAAKNGGELVVIRIPCIGPTKRPYVRRHGGLVVDGQLVAIAYANRRGAIRWSKMLPHSFEIER